MLLVYYELYLFVDRVYGFTDMQLKRRGLILSLVLSFEHSKFSIFGTTFFSDTFPAEFFDLISAPIVLDQLGADADGGAHGGASALSSAGVEKKLKTPTMMKDEWAL